MKRIISIPLRRFIRILIILPAFSNVMPAQVKESPVTYYDRARLQDWIPKNHTIEGWDWSLPKVTRPAPNGYLVAGYAPDAIDANLAKKINFSWNDLEPEEGKYRFDLIRQRVDEQLAKGYKGVALYFWDSVWEIMRYKWDGDKKVYLRTDAGTAPRWLEKYGIAKIEETMVANRDLPFQIYNIDVADPAYHSRYLRMVETLGKSGILDIPQIAYIYIGYPSRTGGEEGEAPDLDSPRWPAYKERLEAWSRAAGKENAKKVCITTFKPHGVDLAYGLGFGQRNGFVEMYLTHCDSPALGIALNKDGYMEVDDDFPPIKEGRSWGDENEEYSPVWVKRFGPLESFPHRYREASLKALVMRRNWLLEDSKTIDSPLTAYVAMELGRNVETSPDVWCYLRESFIDVNTKNPRVVKNFERWMIQRDAPGAETVATRHVEQGLKKVPDTNMKSHGKDDWTARKGKKIGFYIDPKFMTGKKYAVKITYYDNADFSVHYHTPKGVKYFNVKNTGDDKLKTVTVFVHDIVKNPDGGFDFYIESPTGAEISFVRIVKL